MTRIRFEDLPSTNTPRNATNLNKLNNVVISSTEPTTGEEVWIQTSSNLFSSNIEVGSLNSDGTLQETNTRLRSKDFISVKSSTTYTINVTEYNISKGYPRINVLFYKNSSVEVNGWENNNYTFTTPSDCRKIKVIFLLNNSSTQTLTISDITKVMLNEGSTAISYEPYIDKKIYTKNNNVGYEEFYNESEFGKEVYSTTEQVIGKYNGKPLYSIILQSSEFLTTYSFPIPNIRNLVDYKGFVVRKDYSMIRNPIPSRLKNANYYIDLSTINVYASKIDFALDWGPSYDTSKVHSVYFIIKYTKSTD